jgi:hypothetical protein
MMSRGHADISFNTQMLGRKHNFGTSLSSDFMHAFSVIRVVYADVCMH